jgi:ribosomal protein L24E
MKRCETCHEPIIKRSRDSMTTYHARRFCSNKCRGNGLQNLRQRNESLVKKCEYCGKVCPRRKKEHDAAYLAKRFCSHTCARTAANQQRWNERHRGRSEARATIPAPTEAEWLALNGDYTRCPTMYAAPVEHAMAASYANGMKRRGH